MTTVGPESQNQQELRLALAMRGGASMAVWIGGAVAEINHLRDAVAPTETADEKPDEHPWAVLAGLAGYDSIDVDVLAGASAGGLNATLLSASIVYGQSFDRMRDVWIRLADLEAMARPVPKFWQSHPPSLLEGDEYFGAELARVLVKGGSRHDDARPQGQRADLLLTATLLDPVVEKHFDGRSEPIVQQRRTASFRFRHRGSAGDPLSDFGAGEDFPATARKLAHAARTTSSYPFAFEPAQVYSAPGQPAAGDTNMFGVFSEVAVPPRQRPFRVIDGGVLDNIPVTAAIRAIASAAADRPTQRWLLYLNPEPIEGDEERPPQAHLALPVASAALRTRMKQESLLADIDTLDEHNRAVQRSSLRRRALFAELRSTEPEDRYRALAEQVQAVRRDHAVVRAELDAQAVHRLLTEPAGTEDGRLLPPVVGDPLAGWSDQAQTLLRERLSARFGAAAEPDRVFGDVRGFLAAVQECLGWAQDAEGWSSSAQEIGRCKAALYRLQVFGEVLEAHADRYWISGAQLEPIVELGELDGWVDRGAHRRDRLQHHLPSPIRPLLGAVLQAAAESDDLFGEQFQRPLADFARELRSIVDSSGADAVVDDGIDDDTAGHVDAVAAATDVLHQIVDRLAAATPRRTRFDQSEQVGYAMLEHADPAERPLVLRQLVVLTAPLDVGRAPGSHIQFLRVASDAATSLPFDALRGDAKAPLRIEDKVRGADLGSFGAFLSAKWRANDWMWGRMDAAASLVRLLLDPARLVRYSAALGADGLGDAIESVVSRPTTAELGELTEQRAQQWRDFLAQRWAVHAGDVRAELDSLFACPEDEHPLVATTKAVTERLQWTIAAGEVPFVATVEPGADPECAAEPDAPAPEQLSADVEKYTVGKQRLDDLGERRKASMATRFGLIAYRSVVPGRSGFLSLLGRIGMTVLKPLVMAVVFACAAPTRAALVAFLATTAVALTGGAGLAPGMETQPHQEYEKLSVFTDDVPTGTVTFHFGTSPGVAGGGGSAGAILAAVLAAASAVWLGWLVAGRLSRGRGLSRWLPGLVIAAVLVGAGNWLLVSGFGLGPLGLGVLVVLLTWLGTFAFRLGGRIAAVVVTAVAFGLSVWVCDVGAVSGDGWIWTALAVTAYAHMILLSTVDVLAPRPRAAR